MHTANRPKGIILAGGLGSRLRPLTKVTNKHLLPVYDKPMIYYPLETLRRAGLDDIMIVTGGNSAGDFLRLLGNGREFGLKDIYYTYQEGEGGIADALKLCEHFAEGSRVVVILGDNILEEDISPYVQRFCEQESGARLLLKEVPDPERFGVPELNGDRILRIEEKPVEPKSRYAVTGVYMYDEAVFEIAQSLQPSARGELEITDVNNEYIRRGDLRYDVLSGWWTDAGQFESLHLASNLVAKQRHRGRPKTTARPA
ncbi:MAG: NTP transferase domain-containing protein [Candidatus Eremiobacteraeota bacterium]|nr:NTP transferase domain-containing protein [Candidatus Eremiobacteraeota bacterium]